MSDLKYNGAQLLYEKVLAPLYHLHHDTLAKYFVAFDDYLREVFTQPVSKSKIH